MKAWFSQRLTLLTELLKEVEHLQLPALEESIRAMDVLLPFDREFKEKVRLSEFGSAEEEIYYFRHQRPKLMEHMLFHSKRYHIELTKPAGSIHDRHAYYCGKLKKIDDFFRENESFIAYMRSGLTDLDTFLFRRNNTSYKTVPESSYYALDEFQTTSFDIKAGKMLACERLAEYLNQCMIVLNTGSGKEEGPVRKELPERTMDYAGLLKPHQVEKRLNISASTLRRLVREGQIACIRVRKRGCLYEEEEVQRFLSERRHRLFDDDNPTKKNPGS